MFDTYKTVLNADKLYLQDDESVFGHVFIAFLSLYIHSKLEQLLKNKEGKRSEGKTWVEHIPQLMQI